jgi:hypothetical protein
MDSEGSESQSSGRREKPIYPTFSHGKAARLTYTRNHCYKSVHEKPVVGVYEYRPKGLGIAHLPYVPLTHIVDRTTTKRPKAYVDETHVKKDFGYTIDYLKEKRRLHEDFKEMMHVKKPQPEEDRTTFGNFRRKMRSEAQDLAVKTKGMHNGLRYRTHLVTNLLHDYNDYISQVNLK